MGKKKRHGLARQTIPREQKLDPDSSDEGSSGAQDTVLKLDDEEHSTVSSGAGETYTYSQREMPLAVDIQDGERIERVAERMQRTETVSGWKRGKALKEVGVEIPKDEKLYAQEFTPVADPWGGTDDANFEDQPWTKPIPLPLMPRTNRGTLAGGGASIGKSRGRPNTGSTSKVSTAPSNVKIHAPKIRSTAPPVTAAPSRVVSGGMKALGDRTNSGTYAAAVSSNLITDEKPRTVDLEHRPADVSSANTTGVGSTTQAAQSTLARAHALRPPRARANSGASTLGELAKTCEEDQVTCIARETSSDSTIAPASSRNNPGGVPSGASTLAELAKISAQAPVSSPVLDKGKGKSRQLCGAAPAFNPGDATVIINHQAEDKDSTCPVLSEGEVDVRGGDADGALTDCTVEPSHQDSTFQVIADDNSEAPGHLIDGFTKPADTHGANTVLQGSHNNHPPAESTASTTQHPASSIASNFSPSSIPKPQPPGTTKTIMHTNPRTIPAPGLGHTPIIYTATTTTTATGAKVISVDDFEYDYLYPIFTVEVRSSHTVAWYHPHCAEHTVVGLEQYLEEVFKMAEISLFVDYKCDEMGRKVRADVFWPGMDEWVSREVREREGMGV